MGFPSLLTWLLRPSFLACSILFVLNRPSWQQRKDGVLCGGHRAQRCQECPNGNGKSWCNGECVWDDAKKTCLPKEPDVDLYESLELDDKAKDEEIKKAYRRLSLKYHPDKDPNAIDHFNGVRNAYEILSDPVKRVLYDVGGTKAVKEGEQGKLKEGESVEVELPLDLPHFYAGRKSSVQVGRRVICRRCRITRDPTKCQGCSPCPATRTLNTFMQGNMLFRQWKEEPSKEDCKTEKLDLDVQVDSGASVGDRLVFKHMASQMPGEIPGHVTVILKENVRGKNSPFHDWIRRGPNLHATARLTLRESLLGFERRFRHIGGHDLVLSRDDVTKPGQVIRVEGEGMPLKDDPSQFGHLYLTVSVDFPESFTPGEREELAAVQALKAGRSGDDRKQEL